MTRAQLLTVVVLIACGCTESSVGPADSAGGAPPPSPIASSVITGTVSIEGLVSPAAVSLQLESGVVVGLVGSEARRLRTLNGAKVEVRGAWTITDPPAAYTGVSLTRV